MKVKINLEMLMEITLLGLPFLRYNSITKIKNKRRILMTKRHLLKSVDKEAQLGEMSKTFKFKQKVSNS